MPILDIQRRLAELGRIRIGQQTKTRSGKLAPEKLDRFRVTSPSRELVDAIAKLYGGTVQEWQPPRGAAQWEVVTEARSMPVLVPPQPVTQWYELWSGGGCQRRCDGLTEVLSDSPCVCGPDPGDRMCKPTTRLSVVLRDVPGAVGLWRLESHGFYAAVELPGMAELLAQTNGYVSARLELDPRTALRQRDGKPETRHFVVPVLRPEVTTPAELVAGATASAALETAPAMAAIGTASAVDDALVKLRRALRAVKTREQLRMLWDDVVDAGLGDELTADFQRRAQDLDAVGDDPDALWQQILTQAPFETTSEVEADFARITGVDAGHASAEEMRAYLAHIRRPQ